MSEQDLVRACLQYLKLRGIPAWRQNQGGVNASDRYKVQLLPCYFAPPGSTNGQPCVE